MKKKITTNTILIILIILLNLNLTNAQEEPTSLLDNIVLLPITDSIEQIEQTAPPLIMLSLEEIPQDNCVILIQTQEQQTNLYPTNTCTQEQIDALINLPSSTDLPSQVSLELGIKPVCEQGQVLIPSFLLGVFENGIVLRPINPICSTQEFQDYKNIIYEDNTLFISTPLQVKIDLQDQNQIQNFALTLRSILLKNQQLLQEGTYEQISNYLTQSIKDIEAQTQEYIWQDINLIQSTIANLPINSPILETAAISSLIARAVASIGGIAGTTILGAVLALGLSGDASIPQPISTLYPLEDIETLSEQIATTITDDQVFSQDWKKVVPQGFEKAATKELVREMLSGQLVDEIWQDQYNWNNDARIILIKWFPIQVSYDGLLGKRTLQIPPGGQERLRLGLENIPLGGPLTMSEIDGVFIIIRPPGAPQGGLGDRGLPVMGLDLAILRRFGLTSLPINEGDIIVGLLGISNRNQRTIATTITQQDRRSLIGRWEELTGGGIDSVIGTRINPIALYETLVCIRDHTTVPQEQQVNKRRFIVIKNKISQGRVIASKLWLPAIERLYPKHNTQRFILGNCGPHILAPLTGPI